MVTGLMIEMAYEAEREYMRVAVYPNADRLKELEELTAAETVATTVAPRPAGGRLRQLARPLLRLARA